MTVKILGRTNTINIGDRDPTSSALGRANSGEDTIWLSSDLSPEAMNETLIHEILHQISEYAHIDLSETQVSVLGIALNLMGFKPSKVAL